MSKVHSMISMVYSSTKMIKRSFDQRNLYRFLRSLEVNEHAKSKKIIIHSGPGRPAKVLLFESFLASKLIEKGVVTYVLIDDKIRRVGDGMISGNNGAYHRAKIRSWLTGKMIKGAALYKEYSDYLNEEDLILIASLASKMVRQGDFRYNNIDLLNYIKSSIIRFYRSAPGFVEREPDYSEVFERFTEDAILSCELAARVENIENPDIIVTSHGLYSTWGPFYEFFKRRSKRVIVYGFGARKRNSVRFSQKGVVTTKCDDGFFEANQDKIDLRFAEMFSANNERERVTGRAQDIARMKLNEDQRILDNILKKLGDKKAYAIFPNVFWDASLSDVDTIFESPVAWLIETIQYFLNQPEENLIIRVHPAETRVPKMRSRLGTKDVLEEVFGKRLFDLNNIIFIPSEMPVKSYSFFDIIKGGIVYNGTLGLEMMYRRIPVIVGSICNYSKRNFTVDFTSKNEYFNAFDNLENILEKQEANRSKMIRYICYYFNFTEIELGIFDLNGQIIPEPGAILEDENMSYIVDTILEKYPFFQSLYVDGRRAMSNKVSSARRTTEESDRRSGTTGSQYT